MKTRVLFVMGKWPNPSETFLAREMAELARLGLDFTILALQRNTYTKPEEVFAALDDRVIYLPHTFSATAFMGELRSIRRHPAKYFRIAGRCKFSFGPGMVLRLSSVLAAAQQLADSGFTRVHGQFASQPGAVAWILAKWMEIPFSFSCHARDLYVRPKGLPRLVRDAEFVVTCTQYNRAYLQERFPQNAATIHQVYHGVASGETAARGPQGQPPLVLAVGRLVEKKGFADVVSACRMLTQRGVPYTCEIIGEGPLRAELERLIRELQPLNVSLTGWCSEDAVRRRMREATCLVAPSVVGRDGDRDGIPNVILEAMSVGTPVVATDVSGIPEVVRDRDTGLFVPPNEPMRLADAIQSIMNDPPAAEAMATRARQLLRETFDPETNAKQLMELLTRNG